MRSQIRRAAALLLRSHHTVALTGAGISTPSGIPDFRSPESGLWSLADPLDVASVWAFVEQPDHFYRWFRPLLQKLLLAQPNPAHHILAEMEATRRLRSVITQNIDSLHQQAGSRRVIELHGHARTATCLSCGCQVPAAPLYAAILADHSAPRCAQCGGLLKPDVILFGEPLVYEAVQEAQQEALNCDVMLVIGTSLEVMPAADLPLLARRRGARTILVNRAATVLDKQFDVIVRAGVEPGLAAIWQAIRDA